MPTVFAGLLFDALGQMAGYPFGAGDAHERLAAFEWHRLKHTPGGDALVA